MIVSVTGQVVKVVITTSVVTTGTVVPGIDEDEVDEPGEVVEARGVVDSGVVDPCVPWVETEGVELAGAVESGTEGTEEAVVVATNVPGVVPGTGGGDTGVVVLAGME